MMCDATGISDERSRLSCELIEESGQRADESDATDFENDCDA